MNTFKNTLGGGGWGVLLMTNLHYGWSIPLMKNIQRPARLKRLEICNSK